MVNVYRSSGAPGSRRLSVAFAKLMAKGLSVEEMVKVGGLLDEAVITQLKVASELEGEEAYVTAGSHFQLASLEVQAVEVRSRKVVKVYEPAGKGPV